MEIGPARGACLLEVPLQIGIARIENLKMKMEVG
jgi:hypothetical protein